MNDREYLKSSRWDEWRATTTDQKDGIAPPPLSKPMPANTLMIDLPQVHDLHLGEILLQKAIENRKSRRKFLTDPLSLEELAFLLWATQGVRELFNDGKFNRRVVPSAGSRHPFETYLMVNNVNGLEPGLYRYAPLTHQLGLLDTRAGLVEEVHHGAFNQFVKESAVTFLWSVIPYRTEWRYTFQSYKVIALDAGHMCQNLYLACEAIGAGTCAIGAYDQLKLDLALGLDGTDEFVIYLAPVGKVAAE